MKVKGVSCQSTREFVEKNYGSEGLEKWKNALSGQTRKIMEENILASMWYPLNEALLEPTKAVCDVFYGGTYKGAEELGQYSADKSLHGIYKVFVKIASPQTLLKRASMLFGSYYNPGSIELKKLSDKSYTLKFSEFDPPSPFIEYRVMGWVRKALEICGADNINISMKKHAKTKYEFSEMIVNWD